ncbi:piggyBac transposable element-derived protein 4-like [Prorops nasuta]|uniref:piggyBac transposable element-derived protein 4-like n=1 Tax=Prorops nasuta TaxID=863751 RepID=UPI0034CF0BB8
MEKCQMANDLERIQNILNSVSDEEVEVDGSCSENDEDDPVQNSSHNSESEFEGESSSSLEQLDIKRSSKYLYGKDGTRWLKKVPPRNVRTRAINIISYLPGPRGKAKQAKSADECFALFINDTILNCIVCCTNIYIAHVREKYERERDAKNTDLEEIKTFIGLLLLTGVTKSRSLHLSDIWNKNKLGIAVFSATMSEKRFRFLLQCIRFDDKRTRQERSEIDVLAPVREIFELFVANSQNNYSLGEYTTIDEQLVGFRGRCKFRMYMPKKPARYGIKIFALTDARLWYTSNLEIYAGLQPEGPYRVSNKPHDVVMRLIQPIDNTHRNLTVDNWFNSIPLAETLLEHGITIVGTLRSNKREIPPNFVKRKRDLYSSEFGYKEKMTLVSYASKPNKNVLALSTMHQTGDIDAESGPKQKPEIITMYNLTKGGVDKVDEMIGKYSVARMCNRWSLRVFFHILDIAALNSYVIYLCNNPNMNTPRKHFLCSLGFSLINKTLKRRADMPTLPKDIRISAKRICTQGIVIEDAPVLSNPNTKSRCTVCPRSKDVKIKTECSQCMQKMCLKHMKTICDSCMLNLQEKVD